MIRLAMEKMGFVFLNINLERKRHRKPHVVTVRLCRKETVRTNWLELTASMGWGGGGCMEEKDERKHLPPSLYFLIQKVCNECLNY